MADIKVTILVSFNTFPSLLRLTPVQQYAAPFVHFISTLETINDLSIAVSRFKSQMIMHGSHDSTYLGEGSKTKRHNCTILGNLQSSITLDIDINLFNAIIPQIEDVKEIFIFKSTSLGSKTNFECEYLHFHHYIPTYLDRLVLSYPELRFIESYITIRSECLQIKNEFIGANFTVQTE